MNKTVLLIGGPADGRRVSLGEHEEQYGVDVFPLDVCNLGPAAELIIRDVHYYYAVPELRWYAPNHNYDEGFKVMLHQSIKPHLCLEMLFNGYQKEGE